MLQGAEHLFDPVPTRPQPQQARGLERRGETQQVKPLLTGFVDDEHSDRAVGWTLGLQSGVATVPGVEALMKRPILVLINQISSCDLAAICQVKGIGGFALDQESAVMRVSHMGHQLRVTKPTIGYDERCRKVWAVSVEGRQALIEHDLRPPKLAAATRSRPCGVGPTHRKVDWSHQLPVAKHDEAEPPL